MRRLHDLNDAAYYLCAGRVRQPRKLVEVLLRLPRIARSAPWRADEHGALHGGRGLDHPTRSGTLRHVPRNVTAPAVREKALPGVTRTCYHMCDNEIPRRCY